MAVVEELMPLMTVGNVDKFHKIIENVMENSPKNSIFRNNINPLRVGLVLYRLISVLQEEFGYSKYSSDQLQETISE